MFLSEVELFSKCLFLCAFADAFADWLALDLSCGGLSLIKFHILGFSFNDKITKKFSGKKEIILFCDTNASCICPPTGKYGINNFHLDAAWLRFLLLLRTYFL